MGASSNTHSNVAASSPMAAASHPPASPDLHERLVGEDATLAFGARLARAGLREGVVFLNGEIGTGKTTFVRGFLRALGVEGAVRSPTFTLMEEYPTAETTVRHYDLYRLTSAEELEYLGVREHLTSNSLCFFEWPEHGAGVLPPPALEMWFERPDDAATLDAMREVRAVALASDARAALERMAGDDDTAASSPHSDSASR